MKTCHAVPAGMPLNASGEKRTWEPKQAESGQPWTREKAGIAGSFVLCGGPQAAL